MEFMQALAPDGFFNLEEDHNRDLFKDCGYVWEALGRIGDYLTARLVSSVRIIGCFRQPLPQTVVLWNDRIWQRGFEFLGGDVTKGKFRVRIQGEETSEAVVLYAGAILWDERIQLGAGSVVEPGALIKGPTIIGAHTEVRQGAYLRGQCIVGNRCVVGHTTEMKSSVLLDGAKAGHFAYIGDSILGEETNLGAGTKLANLKISGDQVQVRFGDRKIDTGLRKFGAILGDGTEIGCNAVTNPGTLLGKKSVVFPTISVRAGYYAPGTAIRS
jgi:UDP-N-acetylglucosamine diphosphorylase / glucose-1-phosphate thymidylyltransferase / UDP-N-acetylgalactosamine diphosphorylase / glucosamine-1-phosphate N-acetyltransferase / galactosamine-1-phosphate N-acetyltransferase